MLFRSDINTNNQNNVYLPDILLPKNIKFTSTLDNLVKEADLIVMAVASNFYRNVLRKIKPFVKSSHIILSTAKALEENTMKRMSQVVVEELSGIIKKDNVAVLSGPNLAFEIARGLPAATVIASVSNKTSEMVQKAYINEKLRVYTNTDVIGTELGGTIKNIIALAAGTIDGLDYGNNTKAALLVRGLKEMTRLGCSLGAKAETFFGLSGMGDLICTCNSNLSRNWKVGYEVAKGNRLEDVLSKMVAVAEGVNTSRVANELAKKIKVELPIT